MFKMKKKGNIGKHKFCPVCGSRLEVDDYFCIKCGYSFLERSKKRRRTIKWRNLIFLIIVILAIYASIRYFQGKPIIPVSFEDALNITIPKKIP